MCFESKLGGYGVNAVRRGGEDERKCRKGSNSECHKVNVTKKFIMLRRTNRKFLKLLTDRYLERNENKEKGRLSAQEEKERNKEQKAVKNCAKKKTQP